MEHGSDGGGHRLNLESQFLSIVDKCKYLALVVQERWRIVEDAS